MGSGMVRFLITVMGTAGLVVLGCLVWAMLYGAKQDVVVIGLLLLGVITTIIAVGITDWIHRN